MLKSRVWAALAHQRFPPCAPDCHQLRRPLVPDLGFVHSLLAFPVLPVDPQLLSLRGSLGLVLGLALYARVIACSRLPVRPLGLARQSLGVRGEASRRRRGCQ
ncbi:hypothetical protein FRC08_007733 [Ceratobasidium sp. 394]|nr:hypothetical protein FRC08_007733 [Ceratobasidium sp. 394]